jgi:hypothetical protein
MRIRSSFATAVAAAVSAVVFSAAFQPAEAAPIILDNFSAVTSGTTRTSSATSALIINGTTAGSYNGFDTRIGNVAMFQLGSPKSSRTLSTGVFASGTGTLSVSSAGNGTAQIDSQSANFYYQNFNNTPVNFTNPGGIYDGFQIKTGSVSNSSGVMRATVYALDSASAEFTYFLPSDVFWASDTTYNIPFSAFAGVDFTKLTTLGVGFAAIDSNLDPVTVAGNVAYSSTATFTQISVVPEPTQMVFVAGVAATLGAWRMRKLRRNRGESEAAAV